jgi:dephospho-CoA kinase
MVYIGVTGGIGSGKSLVCSEFKKLNIPIFFADEFAKKIIDTSATVQLEISRKFGDGIFDTNRKLKRKELAQIVFQDPDKLYLLNSIVHPAVFDRFSLWKVELERSSTAPYALAEAAVMFETGFSEMVDYVLAVDADLPVRIKRVMMRDSVTEAQVRERMKNQITIEELREESDFIVQNNGSIDDLQKKIEFFNLIFKNLKQRVEVI